MLLLLFCLQRRGGKSRFHLGAGEKVNKDFMGIFDLGLESVGEIGWEGHSRWRQQCPEAWRNAATSRIGDLQSSLQGF